MTSPPQDLSSWIWRARVGSPGAVDELCRTVQPGLTTYVERRMGPAVRRWVEPSDIVQAVLLEVLRRPADLPDDLDPDELWRRLYRTAQSRIRDAVRRHRRSAGESIVPGAEPRADDDPQRSGVVTRADTLHWLEGLVERLPPKYAEPVRLVGLEGLTFSEAGQRLQLEPDTVRKRYERARDRLRDRMEGLRGG